MSCQTMPLKVAMRTAEKVRCAGMGRARFLYNRRRFSMRKQAAEKRSFSRFAVQVSGFEFRVEREIQTRNYPSAKPQPSVPAAVGGKNETRSGGGNRRFSQRGGRRF